MIVTIMHPNWLDEDIIEAETKSEVAFQLERLFLDGDIRHWAENAEVEDTFGVGNYTIEVFEE